GRRRGWAPPRGAPANQARRPAAAMNTGPQIPPPGRSNSSRNAASMVHSPALNVRSRNLKNPLNAALASQRSSSSRPVAGLSDDEDDRGGKRDPPGDVEKSHPLRAAEPTVGGCADASHARQLGRVAGPKRAPRVPSSYATSTERHGRCLSSRADRRARVLNDCAERGPELDPEHRPIDGVELFRSWYASEAYQKHRHDTYAVGVSDSGVQVLDGHGSV